MVEEEIDLNSNFLSLVSQTRNQINIEIILDNNLDNHKELHNNLKMSVLDRIKFDREKVIENKKMKEKIKS
jgi:tRNA 2-selenouridine synthase SelU